MTAPTRPTTKPELKAVVDTDRVFFEAQPWRTTRVRWTEQAELDDRARAGQDIPAILPGYRWATVVHQVMPGGRIRRYCQLAISHDLDPPECVCLDLFRYLNGEPDTIIGQMEAECRGRLH